MCCYICGPHCIKILIQAKDLFTPHCIKILIQAKDLFTPHYIKILIQAGGQAVHTDKTVYRVLILV